MYILSSSLFFNSILNGEKGTPGATGCSLNIVFFFEDSEIYSGHWTPSVSPRYQCVYVHTPGRSNTSTAAEKSQYFKEKHNN